ncbi:MAG: DUF6261 family protein [Tannerellaceae bacterium]|jgi:hypothetical protein|nr:DUF6261 family protein [Tannerellaceae bacterium]
MNEVDKSTQFIARLRNGEHFELIGEIVAPLEVHKADLGEAIPKYIVFNNLFHKEDGIYKHSLKAEETAEIAEIGRKRLDAHLAIKLRVESATYIDNAAENTAARHLTFVLDNFKKITTTTMVEASALIFNMIQDFRLPKYAPHITTLGLGAAVDKLEGFNEEFRTLYAERELYLKEAEMKGTMTQIRRLVDKALAEFLRVLEAVYIVATITGDTTKAAALDAIITRINASIKQYRALYLRRSNSSSASSGSKPGGDGNDSDDPSAGDGIPSLAVSSQVVPFVENDGGPAMHVIVDNAALLAALLPVPEEAELLLKSEEMTDFVAFPIEDFTTKEINGQSQPTGLETGPLGNRWYDSPFRSAGPCEARIVKDDLILARLTGMSYPETFPQ